ncbi:MAG: substrate-binding domain-containing protein [Blastococcus sp.]
MATLKDVAETAGVSLATASRVLSGGGASSPEARRLVLAAAAELQYIASGPARSLRRARTDVLGLLISDIRNPFFADLAHGVEREARDRGYAVLLANVDEDPAQEERYLRAFASQRVDGMLVVPQGNDAARMSDLLSAGRPAVFVDRTLPGLEVPTIGTDNVLGVRQAVEHLVRRGHREVAYISGPSSISTSAERLQAFLALRSEVGLAEDPRLVAEGDFRASSGTAATARILDSGARPTALFAADGLMALGAVAEIHRRSEAWIRRIEVVSFDDTAWFEHLDPPVSAVLNDPEGMGREGVRALLDLIAGEQVASRRLPTTFVDRSAGPR